MEDEMSLGRMRLVTLLFLSFTLSCCLSSSDNETLIETSSQTVPNYDQLSSEDTTTQFTSDVDSSTSNNTDLLDYVVRGLTIACSILSILALLHLLAVYVAMPTLHNLSGLITMSLGVSLLLALLCFLMAPLMAMWEVDCRTLACLTYMAYISSFTWTSVFAVDLVRTFSSATGAAQGGETEAGSKWRRYARASVAGWLLPLVLTVIALVVDVTADEEWAGRPRFGEDRSGFFGSSIGLLAWFYFPVALTVSVNCVLTAVLFRSLCRAGGEGRKGGKGSMALLCVTVTLIFGVTWMLGLLATLTGAMAMQVLADVTKCLLGMCMSLAFVAAPRVWRLVRSSSRTTISRSATIRRTSSSTRSSIGRKGCGISV